MTRRDLSHRDASTQAASDLEYIIHSDKKKTEPAAPTVSAQEAIAEDRVYEASTSRDVTRVLFISRDAKLLNPTQQSLDGYINISRLFDEVHILILREGISPQNPVIRVENNVWIYTAAAKSWWKTPSAGIQLVEDQLEFATGFRPDLIVARDPFESAVVAHRLGKKYSRATQLHILDDYKSEDFIKNNRHSFLRGFLPNYTIPKFASVRTSTNTLQTMLQKKFVIPDINTLPKYQNYESLIGIKPTIDLKDKYKPFVFIILFVGKLNHESTLYRAMDSARFVLKNPRVGMIVLGDGPTKSEFEKRAKLLGIEEQVVFEPKADNLVGYLKSANLLVVTDTGTDSDELVLKGAAAGIPMIMSRTEKREDVFTHGESAFLADEADGQAFTDRINNLLNDFGLRKQFVSKGQEIIRDKFHSDPAEYEEAYRTSIEQAFFVEPDDKEEDESD